MARIEEIERRLQRWARWRPGTGSGGLGFAGCDMAAERVDGDGGRAITQDGEQAITDMAVEALNDDLRATVYVVYLEGGKRERKAAKLGVELQTVDARIWEAHRRLAAWFSERQRLALDERRRVELLQRAAVA